MSAAADSAARLDAMGVPERIDDPVFVARVVALFRPSKASPETSDGRTSRAAA